MGLRNRELSVHIKANAPINGLRVKANIDEDGIRIKIRNAKLKSRSKVFKHRGVVVNAKRVKKDVHFDVNFKRDLECSGNTQLATSSSGIRVLSKCEVVPRAVTGAAERRKPGKPNSKQTSKTFKEIEDRRNKKKGKRSNGVTTNTD